MLWQVLEMGWRPPFPPETPQPYQDLVNKCWATERKDRPAFKDIRTALTDMLAQVPTQAPPHRLFTVISGGTPVSIECVAHCLSLHLLGGWAVSLCSKLITPSLV